MTNAQFYIVTLEERAQFLHHRLQNTAEAKPYLKAEYRALQWALGIITPLVTHPAIAHPKELPPDETRTAVETRQKRLAHPGRPGRAVEPVRTDGRL